jgi:hypothetical protein
MSGGGTGVPGQRNKTKRASYAAELKRLALGLKLIALVMLICLGALAWGGQLEKVMPAWQAIAYVVVVGLGVAAVGYASAAARDETTWLVRLLDPLLDRLGRLLQRRRGRR